VADTPRDILPGPDSDILENRWPSRQCPAEHLDTVLRRVQLLAEFAQDALKIAEVKGEDFRPGTVAAVLDSIRLDTIDAQALTEAARVHRTEADSQAFADAVLTRLNAHRASQGRAAG